MHPILLPGWGSGKIPGVQPIPQLRAIGSFIGSSDLQSSISWSMGLNSLIVFLGSFPMIIWSRKQRFLRDWAFIPAGFCKSRLPVIEHELQMIGWLPWASQDMSPGSLLCLPHQGRFTEATECLSYSHQTVGSEHCSHCLPRQLEVECFFVPSIT